MSSFPFSTKHISFTQNTSNAQKSITNQQQQQQSSPRHSTQPHEQRRESLVKPTWQNVCPGEVPFDTLEKLNALNNGEQDSILLQQQVKLNMTTNSWQYCCWITEREIKSNEKIKFVLHRNFGSKHKINNTFIVHKYNRTSNRPQRHNNHQVFHTSTMALAMARILITWQLQLEVVATAAISIYRALANSDDKLNYSTYLERCSIFILMASYQSQCFYYDGHLLNVKIQRMNTIWEDDRNLLCKELKSFAT